jgi:hypothetical protein
LGGGARGQRSSQAGRVQAAGALNRRSRGPGQWSAAVEASAVRSVNAELMTVTRPAVEPPSSPESDRAPMQE